MQHESEKVIEKKFRRSLKAHRERHKENLKELFSNFGIPYSHDTLTAYFLGVLRAISFDTVAFVEVRGMGWVEFNKIAQKMKNDILSTAKAMGE